MTLAVDVIGGGGGGESVFLMGNIFGNADGSGDFKLNRIALRLVANYRKLPE